VLLDGRTVKTPACRPLLVPSRMLAMAIAAEFQGQSPNIVRTILQPMYRLQWQVQDANFTREQLLDRVLEYVDSDPVCLREPISDRTRKVCLSTAVAWMSLWFHIIQPFSSRVWARFKWVRSGESQVWVKGHKGYACWSVHVHCPISDQGDPKLCV
jgi:chaperone required for assembly of F1-ATPase